MSVETTSKSKSKSVAKEELAGSSVSFDNTIKISDEFLQILESSCTLFDEYNTLSCKKQIKAIETKMNKLFNKIINSRGTKLNDIITLAYCYQNISFNFTQSQQKEELYFAKNLIMRSLNLMRDKELNSKSIYVVLRGHNHLGYIYYKQNKIEKAIQVYDKVVELYLTYTQKIEEYGVPIDFIDIIKPSVKIDGCEKLKNIYIFVLQSLIDLHTQMAPTNNHRLMTCNHLFLAVQLSRLSKTQTYLQWIEKAMTLCDYLLKHNRFIEAKSHLIAATYVKKMFIDEKYDNIQRSSLELIKLDIENQTAKYYIAEFWVKYGLALLRRSTEQLLRLEKNENFENIGSKLECPTKSDVQISQKLLLFNEIEKGIPISSEYQLERVQYISDYNGAYKLFIVILRYLYTKRPQFDVVSNIKPYIQFIIYTCNAYKYMAFYEKNIASRMLLQNRRVEVLSDAIKVIYSWHPNVVRYLRLQLAIAYSSLIHIKFEHLESAHPLYVPQRYNAIMFEIKNLVEKATSNLKMYRLYT